jgi:hypothetical protein
MDRLGERAGFLGGAIWPDLRAVRVPAHRVGEPLRPGCSEWPEGSRYEYGPAGHELVLFRSEIDADLLAAVGRGPCEFALIVEPPLFVLGYRFGRVVPWESAPFAWHLQPATQRVLPPADFPGLRTLLSLRLVDSEDGIIRAQRSVTLSPDFTRALHRVLRIQAEQPFDPEAYVRAVSALYLGRPSTTDLVDRAVVRSPGNG